MTPTTYTPDFEIAITRALAHEGGYVNNAADSGGATNMGITAAALADYNARHGHDWTIPTLDRDQAREFYFDEYWVPLRLHEIHSQELKNVVFATAINQGKFAAIHRLQYCANVPADRQDGKMGPKTAALVNAYVTQKGLVNRFCDETRSAYERLASIWYVKDALGWRPVTKDTPGATQKNKVFEKGWIKRINSYVVA